MLAEAVHSLVDIANQVRHAAATRQQVSQQLEEARGI